MLIAAAWLALATSGRAAAPAGPAAAEVPYELQWVREPGAEACSGARELATAVNAWLGRRAIDGAGGGAMVIDGHIAP
ncbi:MAG TPA: hypothetical protein VHE35_21915, partial [Kofleriaceae bacterium]|nr:hypothetical protein [Kofleriaceae bacterium]